MECETSKEPEILIWGDSYAMQLAKGFEASNDNPKIIQMTKSVCGPFFNLAPINSRYPKNWGEGCLAFTDKVRQWLKSNNSVKYVVLSSHFNNYLHRELLYRDGKVETGNIERVRQALQQIIIELESYGVQPIIFSSMPSNGNDLGRCLAKAQWLRMGLDSCDYPKNDISDDRLNERELLKRIKIKNPVVFLDTLICDTVKCNTHIDSTWLYRDMGHLSYEGSVLLGKKYGFYNMVVGHGK